MTKLLKYQKYMESVNNTPVIIKAEKLYDMIPESIKTIHSLFMKADKELYLVGGSVRDFETGDSPKDFDIATNAMPNEVMRILKGYRKQLQGEAFGVVVVYTEDQPDGVEIATFREDISKGRNPEVRLGVSIEDDVKRRDLTYNAMFYKLDTKEIIDFTGGLKDLQDGVTRMVGDPFERIDEDSLRILRAFRFAARYNHKLEDRSIEAFKKRNQLENIDPDTSQLKRISSERIYEEMQKAWGQVKDYNVYLGFFNEFDMWSQVFPGANINTNLIETDSFRVCLTNLFRNEKVNGLSTKLVSLYKIDGKTAETIEFLLELNGLTEHNAFKLKAKLKKKNADVENIRITDIKEWFRIEGSSDLQAKFLEYIDTPIRNWGKELIDQGWKQGQELGQEIAKKNIEDFQSFLNNK